MYTHHKLDHEFEEGTEAAVRYAVCAVPRSGSSLLCELLFSTGQAGAPAEYFDHALMKLFRRRWNAQTFADYLPALLARKTGPNGVFGFKAHFFQLEEAFPRDSLEEAFPGLRYVYITRDDRLRQAISWARALQTHKWASDHEVRVQETEVFRRRQIDRLISGIAERERRWEKFFAESGTEPLRLTYESLLAAPEEAVTIVLDHIGVADARSFPVGAPTLRRQADELTDDWVRRYLEGEPLTGESFSRAGSS
jgi:trehalose 2-sulfotransferase